MGPEKEASKYSSPFFVFFNFKPVNPSIGLETTPRVMYANPILIPASIASRRVANLQNFCFATSSAITNATIVSSFPYSFSSSRILTSILDPSIWGYNTEIKPTTFSAIDIAKGISTFPTGSFPRALACSAKR